jgi:vitamin B12 transporter
VRLAGSYEVSPGLELFGRVENLLNQDYQEVFGYETAGVAAYAGVRLKLEAPVLAPASWK